MPVLKHFINLGIKQMLIEEYLASELQNAGFAGCELQKTPLGTRITIRTSRPGIVIGKKGRSIRALTEKVKRKFNINVPTIDVETVDKSELNASIQAERVAYSIEKGQHYRRAAYSIIRRIMRNGARGVEITISGKVGSQRARKQTFRNGILSKCGIPAIEGVDKGRAHVVQKSGVIGIIVKIMPENYPIPDEFHIRRGILDEYAEEERKAAIDEPDEFYEDDEPAADIIEEQEEVADEELFDDTEDSEEKEVSKDLSEEQEEAVGIISDLKEEEDSEEEKEIESEEDAEEE